ncbi:MAG TPA: zinc finger domain-containing protein, partial [Usitatibacter sp.]|nr:zinc finger domain-containing protein [Usitatibacter sp.]
RAAGRISTPRWERLVLAVRATLERAIDAGGSTLRDFASAEGRPGYFQHRHAVYGREGKPCPTCATPIRSLRQGQRATFFCPKCQR